jgi:thioredoxin 1
VSNLQAVTDETFENEVLKADKPVLVDFWAPWCGPCRMVHPVLEEVSSERGEAMKIVSINVDENVQYAAALGVMSIPALMIFNEGTLVDKKIGAYPKRQIVEWIDDSLTAVAQ